MARYYRPKSNKKAKKFVSKTRTDRQALYQTKEWKSFRIRFLHHNKQCYVCPGPSNVVDHVIAHKGDISLFENPTNFIPLCDSCHGVVTAKFDKNGVAVEEKMKWIDKMRKEFKISSKVKVIPYRK